MKDYYDVLLRLEGFLGREYAQRGARVLFSASEHCGRSTATIGESLATALLVNSLVQEDPVSAVEAMIDLIRAGAAMLLSDEKPPTPDERAALEKSILGTEAPS